MVTIPFKCRAWILDSFPSILSAYSETVTGITEFLWAYFPGKKNVQLEVEHLQVVNVFIQELMGGRQCIVSI